MERFRLRVKNQPKRGDVWELKLFPDQPNHSFREVDGRELGTCSNPEAIYWLRQIAAPYLGRAVSPGPIAVDQFGARSEPHWLEHEDGMRLALAFSAAKYLTKAELRSRFQEGLDDLPSEVILYWFTLCFYGYRQAAGKAALRTLLTHEEPTSPTHKERRERSPRKAELEEPELFAFQETPQELGKKASQIGAPSEKGDCANCGKFRIIVKDGLCWTCNNERSKTDNAPTKVAEEPATYEAKPKKGRRKAAPKSSAKAKAAPKKWAQKRTTTRSKPSATA
jgi:hypothetical protein